MFRVVLGLAVVYACGSHGTAQPPRGPIRSTPAPAIPINPDPRDGTVPQLPPLPFVERPGSTKPAPPAFNPAPLPAPDRDGTVYLDKLRLHVTLNRQGVVQVTKLEGTSPVFILVARDRGLSTEVFVPGDTIYGFGGRAVTSIGELQQLSQQSGWHYVEGICNGTNRGNAYIGRVHIGER